MKEKFDLVQDAVLLLPLGNLLQGAHQASSEGSDGLELAEGAETAGQLASCGSVKELPVSPRKKRFDAPTGFIKGLELDLEAELRMPNFIQGGSAHAGANSQVESRADILAGSDKEGRNLTII